MRWLRSAFSLTWKFRNLNRYAEELYNRFRGLARAFYRTYRWLHTPQRRPWLESAQAIQFQAMDEKAPKKVGSLMDDGFGDFSTWAAQEQLDPKEAYQAIWFWVRRSIDGTDQLFFQVLSDIMSVHDAYYFEVWKE